MKNRITLKQWNLLIAAVRLSAKFAGEEEGVLYIGSEDLKEETVRYYCYDNLDRLDVPGLDFILKKGKSEGSLTVYNGSFQARAPITFEEGLLISTNFFDYEGYELSERIVDAFLEENQSVF